MSPEIRTTSSTGGQKGVKLERHDLIPQGPLKELAEHYGKGAMKYDEHQWRAGYEWSKSYSSIVRHLRAFWSGQDFDVCSNDLEGCAFMMRDGFVLSIDRRKVTFLMIDPNVVVEADGRRYDLAMPLDVIKGDVCYNHTGSHHMVAVAWHSFALLEFKDRFPEHDDRYKVEPETDEYPVEIEMEDPFWRGPIMHLSRGGKNPESVCGLSINEFQITGIEALVTCKLCKR